MMQKTLLNKTAFNIFTFTFKKNTGFSVVAAILAVMVSPVYIYGVITDYIESYDKLIYDYDNIVMIFAVLMAVAAMAYFMVLLYINFNYLYNKSASDFFHALPLKRSELLFARFFGAYLSALIPLTVGYIGTYSLSFLDFVAADRGAIIEAYFFTAVMMIVLGLFTLLFIITAGGVFDSILSLVAVNIGIPVIVYFIYELCISNLYGFTYSSDYDTSLISHTTPFGYAIVRLITSLYDTENPLFTALRMFAIIDMIALFSVLNIIVYNRRKSEKMGGAYSFKFISEIISLIVASIGLFMIGYIFGEEPDNAVFWIAGAVGACLAAVVYSLIINRGFKKVKNAVVVGVVATVMLGAVNGGIMFDVFRWEYNLPDVFEVESVKIQISGEYIEVKNIDLAVELNKAIVDEHNENYLGSARTNVFTFDYTLKNGKTVTRKYNVETQVAKDYKARLIGEEYSRQISEEFEKFKDKNVEAWEVTGYIYKDGDYFGDFEIVVTEEKAEELVRAYSEDLKTYGNKYFENLADRARSSIYLYARVKIEETIENLEDGTQRVYTDYEEFSMSVKDFETFRNVKSVLDTIDYEIDTINAEKD